MKIKINNTLKNGVVEAEIDGFVFYEKLERLEELERTGQLDDYIVRRRQKKDEILQRLASVQNQKITEADIALFERWQDEARTNMYLNGYGDIDEDEDEDEE